ncbi:MAG: polysaccharide biosynthesis protein [Pseudomonadales bacterium]|nr:polysaccharide biosynthesis protein [Pseudomonadales bacterium]
MATITHTWMLHLHRRTKRIIMMLADGLMIPFALWSAFALRLGSISYDPTSYWWLFILAPAISIPVFARLGLYRAVVRYMGPQAAVAVLKGVTIMTVSLVIAVFLYQIPGIPRSVFGIFWLIAVLYVGGSRFLVRAYFHWLVKIHTERQLVAIYGAGSAGVQLASALSNGGEYLPVAFIDDNISAQGSVINGIQVYSPDNLTQLVNNLKIKQILLAVPSIRRSERQAILGRLEHLSVYVRTVPSMPDLVSGKVTLDQIQDVEIEDLLGRDAVPPNITLMSNAIQNKNIMVTGAAGSIGSELCRQILVAKPRRLILFEISEYGLYSIEKEISAFVQEKQLKTEVISMLGSVQDGRLVEKVLAHFRVDVVFHAAAYKHVPLVEHNIVAGVRNNVFGTLMIAKAAAKVRVKSFVLISTDKAVRPTNVMGATKRLAELILQGLADEYKETCFSMVRFGNVLGSSGSVVPLFRKQINDGGPITVTHPEVSRYFMTIPEAAQLVIQSTSIAEGGDVFVLDMGEHVNILDLAHKMVHLMGLEVKDEECPLGDIEIKFTGLRPGEKLREELLIGENLTGTEHSKILRAEEIKMSWNDVNLLLSQLDKACDEFDYKKIRDLLLNTLIGFKPSHAFVDSIFIQSLQPIELNSEGIAKVSQLYPNKH